MAGAQFVYLASQSPRRRQLLEQIGVRHAPLVAFPDDDVHVTVSGAVTPTLDGGLRP